MADPVLLQKQIRDNAEDMQNYIVDMKHWLKEMKRKQEELPDFPPARQPIPPARNSVKRTKHNTGEMSEGKKTGKQTKISSFDYSKWDKFDVEKACEEVDQEDEEDSDSAETEQEETQRLRDQALYEKELGNEQVKKQNWKEAILCYNRAIQCYAYDAIFYANRALCFLKTKDLKAAETDCTAAIQLDATYVKAYLRRATARVGIGQYKEAKADLLKVLELEPNNTAAKSELAKVELKLDTKQKQVKKEVKVSFSSSSKTKSDIKSTKEAKCLMNQEVVGKGRGDAEETVASSKGSWNADDARLVQTIRKPPHLRSKKPLKRIVIQEVGEELTSKPNEVISCGDGPVITATECKDSAEPQHNIVKLEDKKSVALQKDIAKQEGKKSHVSSTGDASRKVKVNSQVPQYDRSVTELDDVEQIPPVPKSSVRFLQDWKKVKANPKLRFLYLKQIPGTELANIFQISMESDLLSDLLSVLATDFLEAKEPVYQYLVGLSAVKRFQALTLFLSKTDRAGIKKLFEHCENSGECSREQALQLAKKYDLL